MLYVGCERILESPLHAIHQTCRGSQLIILKVVKCKISRFLQFWCKLKRIVKTCPFRFLLDYYGDFFNVMFLEFPNHFLLFPMVFLHVPPSVSPVSYFRFCNCLRAIPPNNNQILWSNDFLWDFLQKCSWN